MIDDLPISPIIIGGWTCLNDSTESLEKIRKALNDAVFYYPCGGDNLRDKMNYFRLYVGGNSHNYEDDPYRMIGMIERELERRR